MNIHRTKNFILTTIAKDAYTSKAIITQRKFTGYAGWTGFGNLGDEAVHDAMKILFPELKPFAIDKRTLSLERLLKRGIPLNAFCLGGGTLINLSDEWLQFAKYVSSRSVPSFCIGTGVASSEFWSTHNNGHWKDSMDEWAKALSKFEYVGVRGPQSVEALSQKGIKSEVVGDSAFSLNFIKPKKRKPTKSIGLNISFGTSNIMWGDPQKFIEEIEKFIKLMLDDGYEVKMMPMWYDDHMISEQVVKKLDHKNCTLSVAYRNIDSYVAEMARTSLFIGEKLHATIFSCILGIPSIMLAYRPKCIDFMESVGMEKFCVRTDSVEASELQKLCHKLYRDYGSVNKELTDHYLFYKNLQHTRAKQLRKKLNL